MAKCPSNGRLWLKIFINFYLVCKFRINSIDVSGTWIILDATTFQRIGDSLRVSSALAPLRAQKALKTKILYILITRFFYFFWTRLPWVKPAGHSTASSHLDHSCDRRNFESAIIDVGGRASRTHRQVCRSRRHQVSGAGLRRRQAERRQVEPTRVSW